MFNEKAFNFEKDEYRPTLPEKLSFKKKEAMPLLSSVDWIERSDDLKELTSCAINKFGHFIIKDYIIFQVDSNILNLDNGRPLEHTWNGEALERLVARWYSDHPLGIGKILKGTEDIFEENFIETEEIMGIFYNLRCLEKFNGFENVVVCDIELFKPVDSAFFNAASVGDVLYNSPNHCIDPSSCVLLYLITSHTIETPAYKKYSNAFVAKATRSLKKEVLELKEKVSNKGLPKDKKVHHCNKECLKRDCKEEMEDRYEEEEEWDENPDPVFVERSRLDN